jgi:two-component system, OmpR family, response regulator RegX3
LRVATNRPRLPVGDADVIIAESDVAIAHSVKRARALERHKPVILVVDSQALDGEIIVGDFHLRPMQNVLHLRERTIVLHKTEADILGALMSHSGEVVSFERLREILQRPHGTTRGSVAVHICMLRQKIEQAPGRPRHLVTVRGRGYCFRP